MKINYKLPIIDFKAGTVILAGAGPGNVELITIKVYQAIKQADIIIYDALVNKDILEISKKIPLYGEIVKDKNFNYKILSHSRKQISRIEISKTS